MKFGTRTTWNGMMRVANRIPKSVDRPRNRSTAKAYAAKEHAITCPIVVSDASFSELRKNVPKVTSPNAFHIVA